MPDHEGKQTDTRPRPLRRFEELTPAEVCALAIRIERANVGRFQAFADIFRGYDQQVVQRFEGLALEEESHERRLLREFQRRFGDFIPPVEEADVGAVIESPDLDDAEHQIFDSLTPARVFELALRAELMARRFYLRAAAACQNPNLAQLYKDLAQMEGDHIAWIEQKRGLATDAGEKP